MANGTLNTNPYSLFDPSQWSNPYSNYQNQALPYGASSYAGWPTDALGNPIQAPPGMTLNQSPAQPQAPAAANPNQGAMNNALINAMASQLTPAAGGGFTNPNAAGLLGNIIAARQQNNQMYGQGGQAASAPAASAPASTVPNNPAGLTNAQYMALRANPGYVQTPGATVPQSQTQYQPSSGALQAFMQNFKPAQSGNSAQFQQGFASALKNLGY